VKKQLFTLGFVAILLLLMYVFGFSNYRNSRKIISDISVIIDEDSRGVISEASVRKIIEKSLSFDFENKIKDLNLVQIEKDIRLSGYVSKVEVCMGINGILQVQLTPKLAKARVLEKSAFYLDKNGYELPLSDDFSARVPVVYNFNSSTHREDLALILQNIDAHHFLKENVVSIRCLKKRTYALGFRYRYFDAFLGNTEEIDRKIRNLKAFLLHFDAQKNPLVYKRINLEVTNQVIATKK